MFSIEVSQDGTLALTLQRLVDGEPGVPGVDFVAHSQIRSEGGRLLATCAIANDVATRSFRVSLTPEQMRELPTGRHRQNVVYVLPDGTHDASPAWRVHVNPLTTEVPSHV